MAYYTILDIFSNYWGERVERFNSRGRGLEPGLVRRNVMVKVEGSQSETKFTGFWGIRVESHPKP